MWWDYFTPHAYEHLNTRDVDLGSTGPLLIPGTNRLLYGNKLGMVFLLNANDLGHMTPEYHGMRETISVNGGRVMAGLVYWVGPSGPTLLIWCEADFSQSVPLGRAVAWDNAVCEGHSGFARLSWRRTRSLFGWNAARHRCTVGYHNKRPQRGPRQRSWSAACLRRPDTKRTLE
ncbi:MAG TPA: hypothetical protein VFB14_28715 [Bryobacteraceae bacterium]|nr:hypothetical protein [Bryobacteraceae bacterium]